MKTFPIISKKIILIILVVLFSQNHLIAQQKTNYFWSHVRFGGGIGLNIGDSFFSGTLAPSAIYEFDNTFAVGLGLNGTFDNQKNVYKSTILGGSLIGLFNIINELQLSAEFEELHVNRRYSIHSNIPDDNYWSPALFIGAGYRSGNVTFGVRYDILYDNNKSIYIDPWAPFVRFYF